MASVPFNNLITFSRGTNATLTGPNGLIQYAPNNLLTFSEQFDNAAWAKNSSSIVANSVSAPDGTRTADTWTPTSNGIASSVRLLGTFTLPVGPTATTSIYVKSAGKRWVYMTTPAASSALHNCWFDLQTGTIGTQGSAVLDATMTAVGDGWYRISTTSTTTGATNYVFLSATDADNSLTVVADGTGVYIWGAQLELGSTATTYNPTTVKNLLGFSEAFDNAAWTKSNASIVTGAQANPINGAFNAQKLMENTAAGTHYALQSVSVLAAPYVLSVYAKAGERSFVSLAFDGLNAWFNLSTGAVGTVEAGLTASISSVGSGWYRCSVLRTVAVAGSKSCVVYPASANGVVSYTGDGNSGVYIYGAQLSDSASLDPYVPTPGAAPSSTAYYGPRFDYDPVTLAPKGILIEEQRTNLLLQSSNFSTSWVTDVGTCTVTSDDAISPDGTQNADKLAFVGTNANRYQTVAGLTIGASYTMTVWLRVASGTASVSIGNINAGVNVAQTVTTTWQRFTVTQTASATTRFPQITATNVDVFAWGAQLEAGAFATSYIPTIASTVTRSADVAAITGSLFSQWYGQSEGTFVVQATVPTDVDGASGNFYLAASDGTIANQIILADVSGTVGQIQTGGVLQFNNGVGAEPTGVLKAAIAFQTNNTIICAGGTLGTLDTSVTLPTVNRLLIGIRGDSNSTTLLNGHIQSIQFYPVRAADFQLQALTT